MKGFLYVVAGVTGLGLAGYFVLADMVVSGSREDGYRDGLGRRVRDVEDWESRSAGGAEWVDTAVYLGGILLIVGCVKLAGKMRG